MKWCLLALALITVLMFIKLAVLFTDEVLLKQAHLKLQHIRNGPSIQKPQEHNHPIPSVLHQIWLSASPQSASNDDKFRQSFIRNNPDFRIQQWSEREVLSLMNEEEQRIYASFPLDIQRRDMARYIVLYYQGGYYCDSDIFSFQSWHQMLHSPQLEAVMANKTCILLEESVMSEQEVEQHESLPVRQQYLDAEYHRPMNMAISNFWMASTKQHPMMDCVLQLLKERHSIPVLKPDRDVLWITGPGLVADAYFSKCVHAKTSVVVVPKSVWQGRTAMCSVLYHLQIAVLLRSQLVVHSLCGGYQWHHASGSWKSEPDWCKRNALKCWVLQYGRSALGVVTVVFAVFGVLSCVRFFWFQWNKKMRNKEVSI